MGFKSLITQSHLWIFHLWYYHNLSLNNFWIICLSKKGWKHISFTLSVVCPSLSKSILQTWPTNVKSVCLAWKPLFNMAKTNVIKQWANMTPTEKALLYRMRCTNLSTVKMLGFPHKNATLKFQSFRKTINLSSLKFSFIIWSVSCHWYLF